MPDLREQAFALFAEGQKVNQVANTLFKKNWAKAKKLHSEWKGEGGGNSETTSALDLAKPGAQDDDGDEWDMVIKVPSAKLDAIIGTFNPCEKATAIQNVLQLRFNAALGLEA